MSIDTGSDPASTLRNGMTQVVSLPWVAAPNWSFERVFRHHYSAFRGLLAGANGPGFALVVVFADRHLCATAFLPGEASIAEATALVVGRHDQADIPLFDDPNIALRHLVVRVAPNTEEPTVRVLDLNTGQGFEVDGLGRCDSVTSTGPFRLRIGAYSLMLIPNVASADGWPENDSEAWESLPESRVSDARLGAREARRRSPVLVPSGERRRQTVITALPGVVSAVSRPRVRVDGNAVGVLSLGGVGSGSIPVTEEQLERGLLVGRYDRCDIATGELLVDPSISRVHLLLIREGGRVFAVDTSSTNGTLVDGAPVGVCALEHGSVIELGAGMTMRWETVDCPPPSISNEFLN